MYDYIVDVVCCFAARIYHFSEFWSGCMSILCVCVETMCNHINILIMGVVGTKFREKGRSYLSGYLLYSAECNS